MYHKVIVYSTGATTQFCGEYTHFNNTRYVVRYGAQLLLVHIEVAQLPRFGSLANDFGTVSDCVERQKIFDLRVHLGILGGELLSVRRRPPVLLYARDLPILVG